MKISFLIPSIRQGGAERQFILLAKYLSKKGYSVNFITYKEENCFYDLHNVDQIHISKLKKIDLNFLKSLVSFVRENNINILFSCYQGIFEGPLLWARIVKFFYPDVKVITGYRNSYFSKSSILIEKLTRHMSSLSITNNLQALNFLKSNLKTDEKKVRYIPNMLDRENFYPLSNEKIFDLKCKYFPKLNEKYLCGLLGSYSIQKNYKTIIEVAKYMQKVDKINNYHFAIYGDKNCIGSQFTKLSSLIEKSGLSNVISLNLSINNVNEILNCFDVIILPSLYEGTPNVVLEALICKKPVIISIAANKSKLILEGINGLIFETNNYYQLADCILKMKNNSIKLNDSYMESFFELYDNKRVVDDYVDCFESIL